jgi:hypothetical protein
LFKRKQLCVDEQPILFALLRVSPTDYVLVDDDDRSDGQLSTSEPIRSLFQSKPHPPLVIRHRHEEMMPGWHTGSRPRSARTAWSLASEHEKILWRDRRGLIRIGSEGEGRRDPSDACVDDAVVEVFQR